MALHGKIPLQSCSLDETVLTRELGVGRAGAVVGRRGTLVRTGNWGAEIRDRLKGHALGNAASWQQGYSEQGQDSEMSGHAVP